MNIRQIAPNLYFLDVRVWHEGKELRQRETFEGKYKAAEMRFCEIEKELQIRAREQTGSLTFNKFSKVLQYYLDRHEPGRSMAYFKRLQADLGEVDMRFFRERFDHWYLLMRQTKGKRTGKSFANATINRYVAWVRAVLNYAAEGGMIIPVSLGNIKKLKEIPRDVTLSPNEQLRLLNVIDHQAPHLSAITKYALQVPCRKSELVNMRRGDLDLINNCIRVHNGATKNGKGIDKPIPPDMLEYFRSIPSESEYLFYRQDWRGKYHGLGDFKNAWRRCLKIAGLEHLTFHSTRHISATTLVDNGTPEQVVMTVAGWSTPMLRTYYNRQPKKTLELVRFTPDTGHLTGQSQTVAL